MAATQPLIVTPETLLPDLLRAYPQARGVLDRYGLRGCGGHLGPVETIQFFARTHGVDEPRLMRELHEAAVAQSPPPAVAGDVTADTIYRRFFTAGIVLILTAGATWGAWLLWRIGLGGSFTGISIHHVNAHGAAQIFGWVGLFIMGFAYQAFPRLWHTTLVAPRLAVAVFLLMIGGLLAATLGMTVGGAGGPSLLLAVGGGLVQTLAVAVFATQIVLTFRRGQSRLEPYVGFALMALLWFLAMSLFSVWHTYMTMTAPSRERLLWYVATYQAPLRDLQIHGLALFMILGVSLRMLPALFNVPPVAPRRAWIALAVLTTAVLGEAILFVAYRWTQNNTLAALLMIPWLLLAGGCWMVAGPWKLWRPLPQGDRMGKFVRAAYGWLAISLVMLLLLPFYQYLSGIPFSHAYYGAVRHAITVGFISLMIMGFASKVVPTLNGLDVRQLPALWGPFWLVNIGCALRVSLQTLTDWDPRFFAAVGISGTLEVAGLAWWGLGLVRIMRQGKRQQLSDTVAPVDQRPARIEPQHRVADVLAWYPATQEVFDRYGFTPLRNPLLRRTLARSVSVSQAAALKGVEQGELLAALNRNAEDVAPARY